VVFSETIYKRVGHQTHRPLLRVENPLERIRALLQERTPAYRKADVLLNSEFRKAREVATHVVTSFVRRSRKARVKVEIIQRAQELGFDACRVTTAEPPAHAEVFRNGSPTAARSDGLPGAECFQAG
jgi:hypothetical protein